MESWNDGILKKNRHKYLSFPLSPHFSVSLLCFVLIIASLPVVSFAQISSDARSMVMGGGSGYITGFESNFYNPANLLIPSYKHSTEIEFGSVSMQLNRRPANRSFVPLQGYANQFLPNSTGSSLNINGNRQKLLEHWYGSDETNYSRYATFTATPFGISWQHGPFAYSVGIRSRAINNFDLTKGWFSGGSQSITQKNTLDRNLTQTIATYNEISVGFAQAVTLVNGWSPNLNRLYVGVAPKFIIPGMFMQTDYRSSYHRDNAGNLIQTRSLSTMSAGAISSVWSDNGSLNNSDLFKSSGWGLGLDMGVTYVKSLGNDVALLGGNKRTSLRKSIRISLSITDIGFVRYTNNAMSLDQLRGTRTTHTLPDGPSNEFTGSPVQILSYLKADGVTPDYLQSNKFQDIRISLPTAFHFGATYQDNWWALTGDLTYGLNRDTFNFGGWIADAGAEIRPLHFLPVRAGLQWYPGHHLILASGLGIDTQHFSIDFGTRFSAPSTNRGFYLMGAAITTLRLHF